MGSRVYRENYLAALEVAHSQLDRIIGELDGLQLHKKQIEDVVGALQPFLRSAPSASYDVPQPEPIQVDPVWVAPEPEVVQPAHRATAARAPEPVAPAAFSPMSESKMDPIQSRINRALGLAVA
jgi:hypothetical protein